MVKAGIVEPTVDPGVVRVRTPGDGEYIPEVFYRWVVKMVKLKF
jgi:nuclear protein localization family protein 4